MRVSFARALTAGALVAGSLAWASPAMAACNVDTNVGPYTLGVGGDPILTTPFVVVGWQGSTNEPSLETAPSVRLEKRGGPSVGELADYAVWLDFGEDSAGGDLLLCVNANGQYGEVFVPATVGGAGESVCLFFHGRASYNPGGCLVFLER